MVSNRDKLYSFHEDALLLRITQLYSIELHLQERLLIELDGNLNLYQDSNRELDRDNEEFGRQNVS